MQLHGRGISTFTYADLQRNEPAVTESIKDGFGAEGLGIVSVSGVPGLLKLREELLLLIDRFAALPQDIKQQYVDPLGGLGVVGWSCGIEALENGCPDQNKGSYYANPLHDKVTADDGLLKAFPSYTTPNVWPDAVMPELRPAFKELGCLIREVGLLVTKQCDKYVKSINLDFPDGKLERTIRDSPNPKGRLLHYYPPPHTHRGKNWCAQHTDHGSLTGLLAALYTKDGKVVECPDPRAGLYIRNCIGEAVKAEIPPSHIAFQMGEAMQIHSGGILRATQHFVKTFAGPDGQGVSRNAFAIFMQPRWDEVMDLPPGASPSDVGIGQWSPNITFGNFTELTVKKNLVPNST